MDAIDKDKLAASSAFYFDMFAERMTWILTRQIIMTLCWYVNCNHTVICMMIIYIGYRILHNIW